MESCSVEKKNAAMEEKQPQRVVPVILTVNLALGRNITGKSNTVHQNGFQTFHVPSFKFECAFACSRNGKLLQDDIG